MLKSKNRSAQLILASGSLRRADLLRQAGLDFEIIVPQINECPLPGEMPAAFVCRTACEKAESIPADELVILAADTTVVDGKRILGKPSDAEEAAAMLRSLSGRTHEVMTGVCLRFPDRTDCFHVETRVTFRTLSEKEIVDYVSTGEPMDMAGAYAIQGGAAKMVRRIEGSYSNVVGLPLCEVTEVFLGSEPIKTNRQNDG
ncbi:MAG: septum formation inhibitor Maf [Victivallales bacterium]|nr:septum formation inhibitor Maf [Victivallales bacterium]